MTAGDERVRCLVLPLDSDRLLVPSAVVAEVISQKEIVPVGGDPDWLLGKLFWRGTAVPLVSVEALMGAAPADIGTRARIAVLRAISDQTALRFYGVLTQNIPRVLLASDTTTPPGPDAQPRSLVLAEVTLEDGPAIIPDLDELEELIWAYANIWSDGVNGTQDLAG